MNKPDANPLVLHVHFHHKNVRAFQQVLSQLRFGAVAVEALAAGGSLLASSGRPRGWAVDDVSAHVTQAAASELINYRDPFGRTVLHLICSSTDPDSHAFLDLLLANPHIDVNLRDVESGWTPLHRALWTGNIYAASQLAARADTRFDLKDPEGYTAFDLYNSTIEGTVPSFSQQKDKGLELFVLGTAKWVANDLSAATSLM